jgi:hypothetical protein
MNEQIYDDYAEMKYANGDDDRFDILHQFSFC